MEWDMVDVKGAWIIVDDQIVEDVKKETGLEIASKHQGADNFRKYLEENTEICNYLFSKFRNALTIAS